MDEYGGDMNAEGFDRVEAKRLKHRAGERKRKDKIRDGIHRINKLLPAEYQQLGAKKIVRPALSIPPSLTISSVVCQGKGIY